MNNNQRERLEKEIRRLLEKYHVKLPVRVEWTDGEKTRTIQIKAVFTKEDY